MDYSDPVAWIRLNTTEILSEAQWGYIQELLMRLSHRKSDGTLTHAIDEDERPKVYDETTTMILEPMLPRRGGSTLAFLKVLAYLCSYRVAKPIQFAIGYCSLDKQCIEARFMVTDALFDSMNRCYALDLPRHDLTENIRHFLYHLFLHEAATHYSIRYPKFYLADARKELIALGQPVANIKADEPQHIVVLPHQMNNGEYTCTTHIWTLDVFPFISWGGSTQANS